MQHSTWHELIKKIARALFWQDKSIYGLCLSAGVDLPTT